MNIIEEIRSKAASSTHKRVVLPESGDERVLRAAAFLQSGGIAKVTLLGVADEIEELADKHEISLDGVTIASPTTSDRKEAVADILYNNRKHKGMTPEEAADVVADRIYFAAGLVADGSADACVAGSVATTGDVIRAALQMIGLKQGSSVVSSIFLMAMPDGKVLTYGDCGVVPYPNAAQLATIALDSSETHRLLTGEEPRTAMLSFSTKGSALHERTQLVTEALDLAKKQRPELVIDGELQFDAAFVPQVGSRKAPDSEVAGNANVFIFPNLDAGNISYKITERMAGATATGPILQGLDKPMMDLSRGCSWEDVVNAACVAILLAGKE